VDAGPYQVNSSGETLAIQDLELLSKRQQRFMSIADISQSDPVLIHEPNAKDQFTEV
jgi:hypothetical protein